MAANLAPFLSSFLRSLPSDAAAAAAANTVVHNSAADDDRRPGGAAARRARLGRSLWAVAAAAAARENGREQRARRGEEREREREREREPGPILRGGGGGGGGGSRSFALGKILESFLPLSPALAAARSEAVEVDWSEGRSSKHIDAHSHCSAFFRL